MLISIHNFQSTWILVDGVNIALSRIFFNFAAIFDIVGVYIYFSYIHMLFKNYSASISHAIKIIQYYSMEHGLSV
jgi:hypothetical protein